MSDHNSTIDQQQASDEQELLEYLDPLILIGQYIMKVEEIGTKFESRRIAHRCVRIAHAFDV